MQDPFASTATNRIKSISLADAIEEAQNKIAELFTHPDDLSGKAQQMRGKFVAEKAIVDSILKSNVQSQLDDAQDGLTMLSNAHDVMAIIKQNFSHIDGLCTNAEAVITNYNKIKKVSRTHQNFLNCQKVVVQFQALSKDTERIASLLEEDAMDLSGAAPNLLSIHHQLFKLQAFRDQTLFKAKSQGPSVILILTRYFKRLDQLTDKFRAYLVSLARMMLQLVRENHGSVIVRLMKIVDVEEMEDERVLMKEHNRTAASSANLDSKSSGEWRTLAESPRTIRGYRSDVLTAIHDFITETFLEKISNKENDVADALETAKFVIADLTLVFEELVPRFPAKYKIFPFFVLKYHKLVYDLINRLCSHDLEARDILLVTGWVREYYQLMSEQLGVNEELLEPRLLDSNEDHLTAEYIKLIRKKLWEWVDRLLDTEASDFQKRDQPPEIEGDGMYTSSAAVILFQMLNQQIDIAAKAARGGRLLFDVAVECFKAMSHFQEKQLKLLDAELAKFFSDQHVPPGFPEYVITLCNNHLKCSEFTEAMRARFDAKSLDERFQADCAQQLTLGSEGFMKVAKRGYHILIDIVFRDVEAVMADFHCPRWYDKQSTMATVISTFADYFNDYKAHLQDYLFTKLTTDAMDRFVSAYVDSLRNKNVRFRMPIAAKMIRSDLLTATEFWNTFKSPKRVVQAFDIMDKLVAVVESSPTLLSLSWYTLCKAYNDVPISFIEELLFKRDDMDRAAVKAAIGSWKTKPKEGNSEAVSSIFTKLLDK